MRHRLWLIVLAGLVIAFALVARQLSLSGGDATVFLRFGREAPALIEYAREHLGEVAVTPLGHDGKYFFMLANDPLLLEPEVHGAFLDNPPYRAQRILYPLVAGLGGALPAPAIVWGMLVVNVAAAGLGSYVTARLAGHLGLSSWLGLAFALNPGVIYEVLIDGSGVLALALALLGLEAAILNRTWTSAISFAGAGLSRETMLLVAAGVFAYSWARLRHPRWPILLFPVMTAAVWAGWARLRLGEGLGDAPEIGDPPFVGLVEAVSGWMDGPNLDAAVAVLLIWLGVTLVLYAARMPSALTWGGAAHAGLIPFLADDTWTKASDSSRALAPLITLGLLLLVHRLWEGRQQAQTTARASF